jgi:hypothetical protein
MKEQFEQNKRSAHVFNVRNMVWLTARDIKIHQKMPKLGPWQLGPYKVLKRIGDLNYRLKLLSYLNLNPVFYVSRLSSWHNNGLYKPLLPESVVVQSKEEYKVNSIIDSCVYHWQLQYLVCWKGYGKGEIPENPPRTCRMLRKPLPSSTKRIQLLHAISVLLSLMNSVHYSVPLTPGPTLTSFPI